MLPLIGIDMSKIMARYKVSDWEGQVLNKLMDVSNEEITIRAIPENVINPVNSNHIGKYFNFKIEEMYQEILLDEVIRNCHNFQECDLYDVIPAIEELEDEYIEDDLEESLASIVKNLKVCAVHEWLDSDTHVGIYYYTYNDEPLGFSHRSGRKCPKIFRYISENMRKKFLTDILTIYYGYMMKKALNDFDQSEIITGEYLEWV